MAEDRPDIHPTLALSTKLEEDFVAPLTAVRGALEILRDFHDLPRIDQQRFINTALEECARLENGVEQLATTVYAAAQRDHLHIPASVKPKHYDQYASRITILDEHEAIEVDFSDFVFSSSKIVNDFYDVLDKLIEASGRSWYIIVNYRGVSIWPEAWVAFAHRGKKVNVSYSLGTVRYVEKDASDDNTATSNQTSRTDPDMFNSRSLALAHINALRQQAGSKQ